LPGMIEFSIWPIPAEPITLELVDGPNWRTPAQIRSLPPQATSSGQPGAGTQGPNSTGALTGPGAAAVQGPLQDRPPLTPADYHTLMQQMVKNQLAQRAASIHQPSPLLKALSVPISKAAPAPEPVQVAPRWGELEGWRAWKLEGDGQQLTSVYKETIWAPGQIIKGNPTEDKEGVHAWKELGGLVQYVDHVTYDDVTNGEIVLGRVHLWGAIVEHELGYRAEFAKIISLDGALNCLPGTLEDLRKIYFPE
jgi:hypothetical protein